MIARYFIALDLSIAVVEQLLASTQRLHEELERRAPGLRVRWVSPEHIHATLKFVGEVDEAAVDYISEALAEIVKPLFPFQLESVGIGAFPSADKPRILWSGVDAKGAEVLTLLHQLISRELHGLERAPDALPYSPHVTLGRVKSERPHDLTGLLERYGRQQFGTSIIKDVALFRSELRPSGPRYSVVRRFPLGSKR